ncbi:MAG: hypothetical protein FWH41_05075 [Treponema sp.]|nr:hypothetical protein [Treponema sp.]
MRNLPFKNLMIGIVLFGVMSAIGMYAAEPDIDMNIRFFDRRLYYAEDNPILIQITLSNNSPSTFRFKLADERIFSLDFDVRTLNNRQVEAADELIRKRAQYNRVYFREIAVEPGESFSFVEDLRAYANLNIAGAYIVRAKMYTELYRYGNVAVLPAGINGAVLESKGLSLNIRPPVVTGPDGLPVEMDTATGADLVRERLSPDKVVEYTIIARQKSQWEKFFLYLDLEEMLKQDAVRLRKWNNESGEGRKLMLDQFRSELRNTVVDGTISVIPDEFVIERTQYDSLEATVVVLKTFKYTNFSELKRYTYFLRQRDNIWSITDYSVVNLGTR